MKKLLLILLLSPLFTDAQVIVTEAGDGSASFGGDGGPAVYAELNSPYGINLDDSGNLYICDVLNERIRKVSNPAVLGVGIITTIVGNGTTGYSGDNWLGIYAQINDPADVTIDHHGNVYIADQGNNCIRKITPADTITTIAGTGIAGYNGDTISAISAQLNNPTGVAVDSIGNVYIADRGNYRIRRLDTSGIIITIAGTGIAGFSPDGSLADTAKMAPFSVRINSAGTIYFADSARVRKINSVGIITTVAGNGIIGYSGDSGLAILAAINPNAFAIDTSGNIYIADGDHNRIREVDTAGIINTIAGNGIEGFYGDNGNPLLAELYNPEGVAVNNSGVYISDNANNRVRLVTLHPVGINNTLGIQQGISIFPNPSTGAFSFLLSSSINEQALITITNVLGEKTKEFSTETNLKAEVQLFAPPGIYFLTAITCQKEYKGQIIIE